MFTDVCAAGLRLEVAVGEMLPWVGTIDESTLDWISVSEAVAQLPFISSLKALYKFANELPDKLRLRPHPEHTKRRLAHGADVLRKSQNLGLDDLLEFTL